MNSRNLRAVFDFEVKWPDSVPSDVINKILSGETLSDLPIPAHDAAKLMDAVFTQMKSSPELMKQAFSSFVMYHLEDLGKGSLDNPITDEDDLESALRQLASNAGEPYADLMQRSKDNFLMFTESIEVQLKRGELQIV